MKKIALLIGLIVFAFTNCLIANIIVDINGGGDYTTIQQGINAAVDGDTVLVADGIYTGANNRGLTWNGNEKHIVLKSENGFENCIIDCEEEDRGFTLHDTYQTKADIIDGFTIKNARGTWGGGIECKNASPTIQNNRITSCEAGYNHNYGPGGGILLNRSSHAIVQNNIIDNNIASAPDISGGGGIHCCHNDDSVEQAIIRNNIIYNNGALQDFNGGGGGITVYFSSPLIENNLIYDNYTDWFGGAVHCIHGGSPIIRNNIMTGNKTTHNTPGGGGVSIVGANPTLINNIITNNDDYGICYMYGVLNIEYCNVWGNIDGEYYNFSPGTGCISQDPQYVNASDFDFHFQQDSPCIDAGKPDTTGMNLPNYDLEGNLRVVDGNDDGEAIIDMGCYEFLFSPMHIYLNIPTITAVVGDTIMVPIDVEFPPDSSFYSAELVVGGYLGALEFIDLVADSTLVGDAAWMYEYNENDSTNTIWMAGSEAISDAGTLINMKFYVPDNLTDFIPITLVNAMFDTGNIPVDVTCGGVEIINPNYGDVDLNGSIEAFDASMILRYLMDYIDLSDIQLQVADVSLDSTVSALDASLILQYGTGILDSLPYQPGPAYIANGDITMTDEEYTGQPIDIPIIVDNAENIYSFQGKIEYDSTLLTLAEINWNQSLHGFNKLTEIEEGFCKFVGINTQSYNQNGLMATVRFYPKDGFSGHDSTEVYFKNLRWNEAYEITNVASAKIINNYGTGWHETSDLSLVQNIPNPFKKSTKIYYTVPQSSQVIIKIYNIKGELVRELINDNKEKGSYQIHWDGKDKSGHNVVNGVYLYQLSNNNEKIVKKMILLK